MLEYHGCFAEKDVNFKAEQGALHLARTDVVKFRERHVISARSDAAANRLRRVAVHAPE